SRQVSEKFVQRLFGRAGRTDSTTHRSNIARLHGLTTLEHKLARVEIHGVTRARVDEVVCAILATHDNVERIFGGVFYAERRALDHTAIHHPRSPRDLLKEFAAFRDRAPELSGVQEFGDLADG